MLHNLHSETLNPANVAGLTKEVRANALGYHSGEACTKREIECRVFCLCKSQARKKKTLCLNSIPGGKCYEKETKSVNDSVRPGAIHKISRSRLFRTNSLARELRKLNIPFEFFNRDCIHFSLNVSDIAHTEVYISATRSQYEFKKQYFKFNSWAFDEKLESIDTTGKDLLAVLVYLGELPDNFQPSAESFLISAATVNLD